jgi:hypothetical protein
MNRILPDIDLHGALDGETPGSLGFGPTGSSPLAPPSSPIVVPNAHLPRFPGSSLIDPNGGIPRSPGGVLLPPGVR